MKTPQEIEDLKHNWLQDPCYDIYDVDGFEDHREELKRWQKKQEDDWELKRLNELKTFASDLGIPDDLKLARFIRDMSEEISRLKDKLYHHGIY